MTRFGAGYRASTLAGAVITAAIAAGTTPAHAVTQQQIAWCENKGGAFSFDLEVSGCTAAIESGKWSGKNLAWAFSNRCNAKNEVNNYDGAIADCSQAIQINPKSPNFFNGRCWGRAVLERDLTAALADCDVSLRLRPDDGNTLNSRGLVQFKLGALDKAASDYDAAVKLNPKDANSLYVRGVIKQKTGDAAGGDADITAAKAIKASVADDNAAYGVK